VRKPFKFKQFTLTDNRSAMKLSTDAVLLGAFAGLAGARHVLDVGTGSGIVALMVAQRCPAMVTGIDIDGPSIEDARENFGKSPWSHRLKAEHQSLQEFSQAPGQKFDVVVSNPPFFSNSQRSPVRVRNLSRHDIHLSLTAMIPLITNVLQPGGSCSFIIPADKGALFDQIANNNGLGLLRKTSVFPKASRAANRLLLEYRHDRWGGHEEETLVIRGENGNFTEEYRNYTRDFYLNF
jgi:tRNA1Val (adenine37-N6)-methyltransferase